MGYTSNTLRAMAEVARLAEKRLFPGYIFQILTADKNGIGDAEVEYALRVNEKRELRGY